MAGTATEVRQALEAARRDGLEFDQAWPLALQSCTERGWRRVLLSQVETWGDAYARMPASNAERALISLRGRAA